MVVDMPSADQSIRFYGCLSCVRPVGTDNAGQMIGQVAGGGGNGFAGEWVLRPFVCVFVCAYVRARVRGG